MSNSHGAATELSHHLCCFCLMRNIIFLFLTLTLNSVVIYAVLGSTTGNSVMCIYFVPNAYRRLNHPSVRADQKPQLWKGRA